MKTLSIVIAVAGLIVAAPDTEAARKRLSVGKKERLHEQCEAARCGAKGLVKATPPAGKGPAFDGTAQGNGARARLDFWACSLWLLALATGGRLMLKEQLPVTPRAPIAG